MIRLAKMMKRKWVGASVALTLAVGFGVVIAWASRNPWPARVVIVPPEPCDQGEFTTDDRGFLTSNKLRFVASWNLATGKRQPPPTDPVIFRRSDSADRRSFVGVIYVGNGDSEVVWADAGSGAIKRRFLVRSAHAFHPTLEDGDRSIRALVSDFPKKIPEVVTWDLTSGLEKRRPISVPQTGPFSFRDLSLDGRTWAYFDSIQNGVRLWDVEADQPMGSLLRTPTTQKATVLGAKFTPDGRTLAVARTDGQIEIWDVAKGHLIKMIKVYSGELAANRMTISPDGRIIVSELLYPGPSTRLGRFWARVCGLIPGWSMRTTRDVILIDLASGRQLARSQGSHSPRLSRDGRTIVTQEWDRTFTVRDTPRPTDQ